MDNLKNWVRDVLALERACLLAASIGKPMSDECSKNVEEVKHVEVALKNYIYESGYREEGRHNS